MYTFEDWVSNKIWDQIDLSGDHVVNDSEKYLSLVVKGEMTYATLNKIQDEQNKAYEYVIESSLQEFELDYKRRAAKSTDFKKVIEIKIKRLEKYVHDNEDLHYEIILPRLHRSIKVGAKFITPEQYLCYKNKTISDAFIFDSTPYSVNINGELVSFPTEEQMKYLQMEVNLQWLERLKGKLKEISNLNKAPVQKEKKEISYNWLGKAHKLTDLHNAIKGDLIHQKTGVKSFCDVFSAVEVSRIQRVKWISTATDLLYFLYSLKEAGLIDNTKQMNYQKLKACFCKDDGSEFQEVFKSLLQQVKEDRIPNKIKIDNIVKSIK